jgi:UDP-3-O-[3-hydroxymyristoyl] glucosamine N-acyltransferase
MRLSEIIPTMDEDFSFTTRGEKDFSFLALTAQDSGGPTCVYCDNPKFIDEIKDNVTMVITTEEMAEKITGPGVCITENPKILYFKLHNFLSDKPGYARDRFENQIDPTVKISPQAYVSDHNVIIKEGAEIGPFVYVGPNTTIGKGSVIHAGTTLGDGGFEHKRNGEEIITVKSVGGIVIGDNVDISHNCSIENAVYPWSDTIIMDDCRIDHLVQISHSCVLHKRVFVVALSCIAGRTIIEEDTWVGVGAIVSNGLHVGANASINLGAVVTKDVGEGCSVSGNFAIDHATFIRNLKEQAKK